MDQGKLTESSISGSAKLSKNIIESRAGFFSGREKEFQSGASTLRGCLGADNEKGSAANYLYTSTKIFKKTKHNFFFKFTSLSDHLDYRFDGT